MAEVTATINRIVMDENYHVSFYNQFGYVAQVLETDVFIEISGNYLVCGSNGDSVRFFANTVTSIETPTLSQTYTPITAGFFQQGSQYFERLTELYDFINTNIVSVVIRDITALKFADGTTQTTAATGGGGSGTVTSVGFTEGTGIDITGTNPITTSGTVTITNTAPDQVVTLGEGTGIDVTGTYPNFTITNTAPDQTVVLNNGTGISVTGTYPSFTIANTAPSSGGTVTSVGTGTGLTGGSITTSGTISLNSKLSPADNLTGNSLKYLRVNSGETAVEYADVSGGGILHGTASGTDTYTTTITGVTGYNDADAYLIRFTIGNTTSATLNINSLGAIPLYRNNDGELIGGDIIDGAEMLCVYNSTTNRFQVIGTAPNTLLAYVTNADTIPITKGQPVYAFGGQGDRLTVKRAYNTLDATSAQTVGLVLSTSIGVNQKGLIILNGQLDGLGLFKPSNGWLDGDAVYLGDTPGSVTRVKPHAPNHLVYLGFVTTANSGNAGRMYVRVQNGYEMDELHDVVAQNPNNNDGLFFNTSNSLWESKSISAALGYTPANDSNVVHTTGNESISGVKTFSDNQIINTSSTSSALRITQTGTGEALRIEDSTNPDSTPVVVTADGWVGIGTPTPDSILHVHNASAGTVTPISGSVMTLENNTTCYFTVLAPDANFSGFVMGSPSDSFGAFLRWGHTSGKLEIGTANSGDFIELYVQNSVSKAFINGNGLGINAQPVASAAFQVDSTTQGVLVSRMTTTQRNAIVSPATGLMVYDTNLNSFYFYNGSTWNAIGGTGSGTVTSITASSPLTGGTITTSGTIGIDEADSTKGGYLSSTDWIKFNGKQNAITLTTTGTSGAATLVGSTLNIPQYAGSGTSKSILNQNHQGGLVAAGATTYSGWSGASTFVSLASEFARNTMLPLNGTINNWAVNVNAQPASGSLVFTLRVNAVDTSMTITIAAGSATNKFYNTTSNISVVQGDLITFKVVNNASAANAVVGNSIMYEV